MSGKNEEQKVQTITIIDNRGDNTLVAGLQRMGELCTAKTPEGNSANVS